MEGWEEGGGPVTIGQALYIAERHNYMTHQLKTAQSVLRPDKKKYILKSIYIQEKHSAMFHTIRSMKN